MLFTSVKLCNVPIFSISISIPPQQASVVRLRGRVNNAGNYQVLAMKSARFHAGSFIYLIISLK